MKWFKTILNKETVKKIVPIRTWKPWKPVVMKKQDPNTLSEIVKGASKYSKTCNAVNKIAKITVIINEINDCFFDVIVIK